MIKIEKTTSASIVKILLSIKDKLLGNTTAYRLFSGPFQPQMLRHINKMLPDTRNVRVLDIGCGPASRTSLFLSSQYTGIDINADYIKYAKRIYPTSTFLVADATKLNLPEKGYDLVFINSFLHHMSDSDIKKIVEQIDICLVDDGIVLAMEPLQPAQNKVLKRFLIKLDRGKHVRSYEHYYRLFLPFFHVQKKDIYQLKIFEICGWEMLVMCLRKNKS